MDNKEFINNAFLKLSQRGWLEELKPSEITESDVAKFEKSKRLKFPAIFKAYLTAFKRDDDGIVGISYDYKNNAPKIKLIDLYDFSYGNMAEALKCFRSEFNEWEKPLKKEKFLHLFPVGYSDGWYCLDLSRSDGEDCPVAYLEYGGFWEENGYFDADGVLHGELAAPNFRTFLE